MHVLPRSLPLRPGLIVKSEMAFPAALVEVFVECDTRRVGRGEDARVPEDDVVLECDRLLFFALRAGNLNIPAQGKNVVQHHVVVAVMQVKPAVGGAVDEIFFDQRVRASLIKIDAPPAINPARDVVKNIA